METIDASRRLHLRRDSNPKKQRQERWFFARSEPVDLGAGLLRALQSRHDLDTSYVDDVVMGCVTQLARRNSDITKMIVQNADWDESVPGVQLDRFCASGLEAVNTAAQKVASGWDLVVAGGIECISRVPMGSNGGAMATDPAFALNPEFVQGIGADMIAAIDGYSREDVDAYAMESQRRATHARDNGWFDKSVIPVKDAAGITILPRDDFIGRYQHGRSRQIEALIKSRTMGLTM